MPKSLPTLRPGAFARIAGVSLLASLAAACAADSQRFAGNPFSNPFDSMKTGSLPRSGQDDPQPNYTPPSSVARAPLGNVSSPSYQPVQRAASGQSNVQSLRPDPVVGNPANWTAAGGTPVTVDGSDTVQSLANRYGVPASAIVATNNLRGGALTPGSQVVIPVYAAGGGGSVASAPVHASSPRPQPAPVPQSRISSAPAQQLGAPPQQLGAVRNQLAPGQKLNGTAGQLAAGSKNLAAVDKTVAEQKAAAKSLADAKKADVKAAEAKTAEAKTAAEVKAAKAAEAKAAAALKAAEAKQAAADAKAAQAAAKVAPVEAAKAPEKMASAPAEKEAAAETAGAGFRWPVRGRIIGGFNGKGGNEGINIAVPEGTPVKAAEGGVVAYAGSELKGYGNLVLIRHDNGWVSAYANNGQLLVKRGEKVTRGQSVAKSGQSGNVSSPQLHFELRKGSTPVDPVPHLAGS